MDTRDYSAKELVELNVQPEDREVPICDQGPEYDKYGTRNYYVSRDNLDYHIF